MQAVQSSHITIRVTKNEKEKFTMLSAIDNKPVSKLVKELVDKELNSRKLSAADLRRLPKEIRTRLIKKMTAEALPVYKKYKKELFIDETGDGIE